MSSALPPPPPPPPSEPAPFAGGPPSGSGRSAPNRKLLAGLGAGAVVVAVVVAVVLTMAGDDEPGPTPTGPTATGTTSATGPTATSPTATPSVTGPTATGPTTPTGPTAPSDPTLISNTTPITIPDSGQADLYPSVVEVSGVVGEVADVNVTIEGLTHTFVDDVDLLLVGPTGQTVVLMADVGGDSDNGATDVTLTFDDAATVVLPDRAPVASGVFLPTSGTALGRDGACCDFAGDAPAPAPPYSSVLGTFNGIEANGTWSLYVFDDTAGDVGEIAGGWTLEITVLV